MGRSVFGRPHGISMAYHMGCVPRPDAIMRGVRMPFFVLEKAQSGGSLRLPIDGTFESREEALAALSAAVAAGEATVTGQVFVADLDSALPVLVMATPVTPAAPSVMEPEASEDVIAEEPETVEQEVMEEPVDAVIEEADLPEASFPAEDTAVGIAGGSLVDALKRAASSLEDEGITAPESINADDFSFEEDLISEEEVTAAVEEALVDDAEAEIAPAAPIGIAEPMSAQGEDAPEVLEAPADWPWANVEAFDEPTVEEPEEPAGIDAPAAFEEPDTLITSAPPAGEEAYVPRPVILGDYASMGEADADIQSDAALDEGTLESAESAAAEPAVGSAEAGADESPFDVVVPEVDSAPAVEVEMAYEPTGELDLASYTCNDCVYANTCPKVGEVTPADCGTFQWRAS